ncbi:TonB-dependent receptor [Bacteroides eggerthii]|jgi:TonB-dependent receptor|uniref:TonB-dependent receptor n=1 Tax=Bacteroides eggerthii TaxID=28111 RepID=UPI001C37683E|nr:TonB-dependent receptor [Bacteroides eggerthii]MBV3843791.1 TonB-dependent receptor [Bacteroides eggerthii]MBV3846711.1 TonB-dependent receptor [Bacteroides eggerthii]MBV3884887.1 TonB-dependent receptor [Bacteroides eggerthii]MBV3891834.1 TonB-dependent receptor [Bacteroides eggerthii]MBV3902996.1 TonB-dependent receptor [Bacteroides eggerthii]
MKSYSGKVLFFILFLTLSAMTVVAGTIKGTVTDKQTREPLTGATIQIAGTTQGTVADVDGNYSLDVNNGTYTLAIKYVGYKDIIINNVKAGKSDLILNFELESDAQALGEVSVVARKNLEGERALQMERRKATLAIENLGSKEMSLKGIGNVEEGVKKITGISVADAGQLIVRGLGDRYSTTTLNGLPIASPNPDNKLIPLDLFPSSTVQNITVSKVYNAEAFADYSGAHIDINTKENITEDFFNIGFNTGGKFNTLGKDSYRMNRNGSLFRTSAVDQAALNMPLSEFDNYVKTRNIFDTSFAVKKKSSLPDFSGNLGFGKNIGIGSQTLSILASASAGNSFQNMDNAFYKTLEATGSVQDNFAYDSYAQELKLAALGHIGYTLRRHDRIGYTFFYARNATDTYQRREGIDAEDHELTGSNNITHIYSLQNHQLDGVHSFGRREQWELTWGGSYSKTGSEEPDRRQVMYIKNDNGALSLFKLNRQETMRYFGSLDEEEWNGNLAMRWKWNENNFLKLGVNYKNKSRDYKATRFYYNLNKIDPVITDIYDTDGFLNQENIADGNVVVQRVMQPKDSYRAGNEIYSGYLLTDFYPVPSLLVNLGVRYEISRQWVDYATDGGDWYAERRNLDKNDLFPTLNLKYTVNDANSIRFSASRTVTRPSFIEMAPFLYQESYGSAQIRGNNELQNGYNYNFDLRYEHFGKNGDMISLTAYFKYLDSPIERIQALQGGATLHSFQNADNGMAGGMEVELRKQLMKDLRLGANISYMYTNVKLPEGGAYTNKERPLQGASPILANADLTYSPRFGEERQLNLALLYNLQGSRIHAVGVSKLGDIKQQTLHTLNFSAGYDINSHFSLKLQVNDLLNRAVIFKQEVPSTGEEVEVERYKKGANLEIGFSYKL